MHFVDQAKIYLKSGAGGPGAVAVRREKYIEYGGPNGGNGGKGGDVVMVAVPGLNTLIDFRYTQHFRAKRGGHGMGQNRTGASAPDLVIQVPVGTQVFDEEREELLADVGLVGLPNAGKSTFINQVSNAKAKVGDYAFTTLVPSLGVVRHKGREFVLADIPGLIEGAADGAGIGDRFLGHIERCRVLIHLIDISGEDPVEAMKVVEAELAAYGAGLEDKPRLYALNKVDLADAELAAAFANELTSAGADRVFPISAATGAGVEALLDAVLVHLPARTSTEQPHSLEEEDDEEGGTPVDWSPI